MHIPHDREQFFSCCFSRSSENSAILLSVDILLLAPQTIKRIKLIQKIVVDLIVAVHIFYLQILCNAFTQLFFPFPLSFLDFMKNCFDALIHIAPFLHLV